VSGEHNVQNALAAITLAIACGLTLQQSTAGLNGYGGVPGRQQFVNGLNRSLIIDDSYNANPASLQAALKVLCALDGTPWLALGDMAELGDESLRLHQEAARSARAMGVIKFFALGSMSCTAASVFDENGHCFQQHEEMAEHIRKQLHPGINLLIKGSRSAGMEKVVALLTETARHAIPAGGRHAV
jgi:UDP-N-acetylmuramoyl-tripeptide--D-alanyl-D-alanine ligase